MLSETEPVDCTECGWSGNYARPESATGETIGEPCPKCGGVVAVTKED